MTTSTTVNDNNTTTNQDPPTITATNATINFNNSGGNGTFTTTGAGSTTINANNSTGDDTIDIDNASSATVNFNNSQGTDTISIASDVVSTTVNLNNSTGDDDQVDITGTTSVNATVNMNNSTGTGDKVDISAATVNATVNMNNSGGSDDVNIGGGAVTATLNLNNSGGSDDVRIVGTSSTTATVNLNNSFGDDTIWVGSLTGVTKATVNLNGSGGTDQVNIVGSQNTATVNLTNSTGGGIGDTVILAGAGAGTINASNSTGNNTLIGGNTTDTITGGLGNDTVDLRGAGTINAGAGNDLGIYTLSDHYGNGGAADYYYGQGGTNTLRIVLTSTQYTAQTALGGALYGYHSGANTINPGVTYTFNFGGNTSALTVAGWQTLEVSVLSESLKNDTGASATDKITNDETLVGTGEPDALVTLIEGATTLGTATADSSGAWIFAPTSLADGTHTIVASETDAGGTTVTASLTFTLDTTIATPTVALTDDSGGSSSDLITNDAALTFSTVGETVTRTFTVDGGTLASSYVAPTTDGGHTVVMRDTDVAGNTASASITFIVDNTPPSAGTLSFANLTDTGSPNAPPVTADNTFDLSLSGDSDLNGVSVAYQQNLNGAGWTGLTGSSLSGLADGSYQFQAVVTDNAGNSSTTAAIAVIVDNTPPSAGTLSFANLTDTGSPNAPPVTADNTFDLSLSGDSDLNGVSVAYQQNLNGAGWTGLTGSSLSGLADGSYQFQAVVTDNAGNSSTTAAIAVIVDNTPPSAGTLSFANLTDTGSPNAPPVTADNTFDLSLSGDSDLNGVSVAYQQNLNGAGWTGLTGSSLSGLADGSYQFQAVVTDNAGNSSTTAAIAVIVDNTPPSAGTLSFANLTDTGSPNAPPVTADNTFDLSLSGDSDLNGVSVAYQQNLNGAGWTGLTGSSLSGLADGSYQFQAVVTDNAGNSSTTAAIAVIVDNTPPSAGTLSFANLTDTGSPNAPPVTADNTFDLSLSGDSDLNGVSVAYQQNLNGAGWTGLTGSSLSGLADGSYQFQAVVTDNAGNSSTTAAIAVIVDNTPPSAATITSVTDDVAPMTGALANGASTNDPNLTVKVSLTGTGAVAGDTIQLYNGAGTGSQLGVSYALLAADITNGFANVQTGTLTNGTTYAITARITDAAGNQSAVSANTFTVTEDTTAPSGGTPDLIATSDSGLSNTDNITNITNPTFSVALNGTVTVGDTVELLLGGSSFVHAVTHTITSADISSGNVSLTVTAGDLGTDGSKSISAKFSDSAGNTSTTSALAITLDTTPPADSWSYGTNTKQITVTTDTSGIASVSAVDITHPTTFGAAVSVSPPGTWTIQSPSNIQHDSVTVTVTDTAGNTSTSTHSAPAGIAGSPINLALTDPGAGESVALTVSGMPVGWSLNQGVDNGNGTWTVQTNDPASLAVTTPTTFAGAMLLNVNESWTNADRSAGTGFVSDNVEAYPASPIFAVSGDDTLTGVGANDEFVFAQPIGNDTVHNFNAASDTLDLIGFGVSGYSALQASIANDANGDAVITLGTGETIKLVGVAAALLSASNFVFNQEPTTTNSGTMTIGDGATLPLGGTVDNTGAIALNSTGDESDLEILAQGATLQGGGQIALSDNSANVIYGSDASVLLTNVDNTITGAGQIGQGQLALTNEAAGLIEAMGANVLVIDTGANTISNAGTLEATGAGGLVIASALTNSGTLWANGGDVTAEAAVSGGGVARIGGGGGVEFAAAFDAAVSFDSGTSGALKLDQSSLFSGTVAGFVTGDAIDLTDIAFGGAETLGYAANASNTGGLLTINDGTHTANLALLGQYAAAGFTTAADPRGGTIITDGATQLSANIEAFLTKPPV